MNCKSVSIICPIYNEARHIGAMIDSVLHQDYPKERMEVLFIDGMSTDGTREIVADYHKRYPQLRMVDNPHHVVPYALNEGIRQSTGEVIVRLDAHCRYPDNYVSRLVEELFALDADNVGGVCRTLPVRNTAECIAIAEAGSHPLGVGGSKFRIGVSCTQQADTVPFGCFRRELFNRIGLFDEDLIRNQDDEFNGRIIKNGGKIYLIPDVVIEYDARDTMAKTRKMYYQYGLFKPLVNKKLGSAATIRQFFPSIFVAGLVLGAVLSALVGWIAYIYFGVLAFYLFAGLAVGAHKAVKYCKPALLWLMPYTFINIHLSYGIGYIKGLIVARRKKTIAVELNH